LKEFKGPGFVREYFNGLQSKENGKITDIEDSSDYSEENKD